MPLASSRSASEQRAAAVKAERERKERRERISLPKTIRSSTRVTRDSVKRRRESRAMSVERSKKQVKPDPQEEPNDPENAEASKENQVVIMSPERKQQPSSDEPLQILSPTPYWKVSNIDIVEQENWTILSTIHTKLNFALIDRL
jgi:hypothetical protein